MSLSNVPEQKDSMNHIIAGDLAELKQVLATRGRAPPPQQSEPALRMPIA